MICERPPHHLSVRSCLDTLSGSAAETDADPRQDILVLGTATSGGDFQLFGQYLAEVINESEPSLRVGGPLAAENARRAYPYRFWKDLKRD